MDNDMMFGISQLNNSLINANNMLSVSESKRQDRKFMREMYERQLTDNIMLWTMQNQYNSPSAQRERLRDANLNENLVYGSGGVVGTTNLPQSAHVSGGYSQPAQMRNLNTLGEYLQLRNYEKNLQLIDAQTQDTLASKALKEAQAANYGQQTELLKIERYVEDNIAEYRISQMHDKTGILDNQLGVSNMYSYQQAQQEMSKLIAEVVVLGLQQQLTTAQISSVYKDIEVKNATIKKIMADTNLSYAQAENIYDTMISRAIKDNLDIQKFILNPYGNSNMGFAASALDNLQRAFDEVEGNDNYPTLRNAIERVQTFDRMRTRYPIRRRP